MLVLARTYPNAAIPILGLWAERLTVAATEFARPVVVSPVPYVPPAIPMAAISRFRKVPAYTERSGVPVYHPRVPPLPGYAFHRIEARVLYPFIKRAVDRVVKRHRIDLIHAHFIYPEGVIAARIGRRLGVPVVTTEHALWLPWLDQYPSVRRQVLEALETIEVVTAVSSALSRTILSVSPGQTVALLPNLVDDAVFQPSSDGVPRDPDRVLFVGVIRHVKGLDVLVHALPILMRRRPNAHVVVVGSAFFRSYTKDLRRVEHLIRDLGLEDRIRFVGQASPSEVAEHMRRSAVLAVPSRRESFSAVTVEALATGTPVVATRCGGPEEIIVDAALGRLVPTEDPNALADALADVMESPELHPALSLRAYAQTRWGHVATVQRLRQIYQRALEPEAAP